MNERDDMLWEDKCEDLMNIVVESRKRFGKLCIEYELKSSQVEHKLLNSRIETIAKYNFKPKQTLPQVNFEEMNNEIKDFKVEIEKRKKEIQEIHKEIKNTQDVVLQIKKDKLAKKMRQPIIAEIMLSQAKNDYCE